MNLGWTASPLADGYRVYAWDGSNYRKVGETLSNSATSWSSAGARLFPKDSTYATRAADSWTADPYVGAAPLASALRAATIPVTAKGAGVVVSDGTSLYCRAWSTYPGPTKWKRVGTGLNGTTAGADLGDVGPDFASKRILSAFHLDGVIYNGYALSSTTIEGVPVSAADGATGTRTLTFSQPLLDRTTGSALSGASGNVQLAATDERIYSTSYNRTAGDTKNGFRIREYDRGGTFIADHDIVCTSFLADGLIADGDNLYFTEWGGANRVAKVSTSSWKVTNQFASGWTGATNEINGCYDAANDVFWTGALDSGHIYRYPGPGLDLRDSAKGLYEKTDGEGYDTASNYWFRVVPYSEVMELPIGDNYCATPTFDNRTVRVNDDPRHTEFDLESMSGHGASVRLDTGALTLDTTDLSIDSYGPAAEVTRHYDSTDASSSALSAGWRFGFEQTLSVGATSAVYVDGGGTRHTFAYSAPAGAWVAPNGYYATLTFHDELLSDYWTLEDADHVITRFTSSGALESVTDRNGNRASYGWSGGDLTITAANGQTILMDYNNGKVISATYATSAGTRRVEYAASSALTVKRYAGSTCEFDTVYTYSGGRVVSIAVPSVASIWSVNYGSGGVSSVSNTSGGVTPQMRRDIVRDVANRVATITTFDGATRCQWNPTGTMASSSEEGSAALVTTFDYDAQNLPTLEVSPTGKVTRRTYDAGGRVTYEWDEAGRAIHSVYNAAGDCVRQTDVDGSVTSYVVDAAGNVTAEEKTLTTSGQRSRTEYTFDYSGQIKGRLTSQRSKIDASAWAQTDYADFDVVTGQPETAIARSVVLSPGTSVVDLTQHSKHDAFGGVTAVTDAMGVTTVRLTYDVAGRGLSSTDASGVATNARYDSLGRQTSTWKSHESTTTKLDQWAATVNGAGLPVTETTHDSPGNVISTTTHTYDALGRETATDDSQVPGKSTSVYDSQGNATKVWEEGADSADAASTRIEYDAEGREVSTLDPGALTADTETSYTVDSEVDGVQGPDGSAAEFDYSASGDLESESEVTDEGTATTGYDYDLDGQITAQTAADGSVIAYTYDLMGRQTAAVIAGQPVSTTEYNTLGWVLRETDFDGIVKTYVYDKTGRVTSESRGGIITGHAFDSCGRELVTDNADGSRVTRTLDIFGRVERETHRGTDGQTVNDVSARYDSAGRIASAADTISNRTRAYSYAADGRLTYTETRGARSVTTVIDGTGLQRSVIATLGGDTPLDLSVVATDSAGRVTKWTSAALSGTWTMAYDEAGRPYLQDSVSPNTASLNGAGTRGIAGMPPRSSSSAPPYRYDSVTGKKNGESFKFDFGNTSEETTYTYDITGRLRYASANSSSTTYAYNPTSGALSGYRRSGETSVALAYSGSGRIQSVGQRVYAHDPLGRRTSEGPSSVPLQTGYQWAGERLTGYSKPGVKAANTYDAYGQRTRSVVTNGSLTTTTTWTYDGIRLSGLEAVRSDNATWSIDYIYDERGVVTEGLYASGATTVPFGLVVTDRGDVRELQVAGGGAFAFYRYDAYGNPTASLSAAAGSVGATLASQIAERQVLRYASYAYDGHSGLYYCSQRYYDPATACFISKDPARADGEESAYQYCGGDPVGKADPSGLYQTMMNESGTAADAAINAYSRAKKARRKALLAEARKRTRALAADRHRRVKARRKREAHERKLRRRALRMRERIHARAERQALARKAKIAADAKMRAATRTGSVASAVRAPIKEAPYYDDDSFGYGPVTFGTLANHHDSTEDKLAYSGVGLTLPPYQVRHMSSKGRSNPGIYVELELLNEAHGVNLSERTPENPWPVYHESGLNFGIGVSVYRAK